MSGRLDRAIALLETQLAAGPAPARPLLDAARAEGIPLHILAQAKERVGVHTQRVRGGWQWSIWQRGGLRR